MKAIQEIFPLLTEPHKVVITTHQKPDPDAMGSSLGLYHFLISFGHEVTVISPTNWATWLNWMPASDKVVDFELSPDKANDALSKADWLFCLDFNIFSRTKHLTQKLYDFKGVRVLIDHHQMPDTQSFDYGISNTAKSSTAEMVYDFIAQSGHTDKINTAIAECLYAGVMADTGSFRFASTTASVHQMVALLKERGLEHSKVHENIYDNFLENRLRFIGHVLMNRMEVYYEYNTALIAISKKDLLRFQIRTGDTEGLVNYPLSIQGIKLAGLVIDRDEERKWSFRSKGGFDTNTFARKYFNGGGHYNASGGKTLDSLEKTVEQFQLAMKENAELLK
ncbi:MAG: bifunctional oligoribonuclease/PAP phosphatase NrnA [Chitinophagaceae bacterium]|nr:MAG: bifunctional oligoribonuclease/PAP phosphatase NrnA [Chitinophagaceae bacterium]